MAIDTSSVTSHFPDPQDGFTTTTSGSVSSGAGTVGLNSTGDYSNGDVVVYVIDPEDANKKQVLTGVIDTGGVQVTSVVWVGGTNQSHASGATVVDYFDAAHIKMMTKGIRVEHGQDGTHSKELITSRSGATPAAGDSFVFSDASDGSLLKKSTLTSLFDNAPYAAGIPVQVVGTDYSDVATGTTVMPFDDTIPQNTEGDQYMTQAITPKATNNTLYIDVTIMLSSSISTNLQAALFQDSTADAIAAADQYQVTATGPAMIRIRKKMTAGTTSEITFKVRGGSDGAATTTFNGSAGTRRYGAITKSSIVITEVKA